MTAKTSFSIIHHFSGIKDPRLNRQKKHQLQNVFFVSICAKICEINNCLLLNDLA
ncbi:transposase family protein [Methylobacter tundripaludum]|uniref:transposase family protein n=1 Tax=Methylobacter tundripaludum TaxID=173365 RepID=UPI0009E023F1|nr:transposase family protein [Methylobacter tundripaludum]